MHLVALHLPQQVRDLLRLGHELRRAQVRSNLDVLLATREPPEEILDVEDADDVVGRTLVDRDPRVAHLRDALEHLAGSGIDVDPDDVGPRDHDLAHRFLREAEDRRDHPLLALLEHALGLPGLDEGLDLLLGDLHRALRVRAERARQDARQQEQHADEGLGDPDEDLERPHQEEKDGLRVSSADRARDKKAEEDRDHREHGNGDRHRGRAHQRRRARAEEELEDLREARGDEGRGDARVREDDQELDHLERCEVRRRTLSHRPRTAPTTAA